ncbi:MAG TPA: methyltransferase domain-containing protein [Phycisphaerae bacterium]|jgi:predicted nicotinamide N-methyase
MTNPDPQPAPSFPPFTSRFHTRIHRLTLETSPSRTIDLLAPADPDTLLDDAVTEARYQADNYLPYWPIIWPSGLILATKILSDLTSPPALPDSQSKIENRELKIPSRAIELGSGLGLAGIAAALRGWHVTFTDYDPEGILFAHHNALRNGIPESHIRALHMDWRAPINEQFPWVIASDVLYERRLHPLVLSAIKSLLAPGGTAWVSDPQRTSAEDFPLTAAAEGFKVTTTNLQGTNFTGGPQPAQLYVLTRT